MTEETLITALEDKLYITFVAGVLVIFIKLFINSFTNTGLEKKLMTPLEKFLNHLSSSVLVTIISLVFIAVNIVWELDAYKSIMKEHDVTKDVVIITFIILVFGILIATLFSFYILKFLEWCITINYRYFLIDDDNERSLEIIRMNGKGILLVKHDNEYSFYENPFNMKYRKEISSGHRKLNFYTNLKFTNRLILLLVSSIIVSICIAVFINNEIIIFLALVLIILLILSLFMIWVQYIEYKSSNAPEDTN